MRDLIISSVEYVRNCLENAHNRFPNRDDFPNNNIISTMLFDNFPSGYCEIATKALLYHFSQQYEDYADELYIVTSNDLVNQRISKHTWAKIGEYQVDITADQLIDTTYYKISENTLWNTTTENSRIYQYNPNNIIDDAKEFFRYVLEY